MDHRVHLDIAENVRWGHRLITLWLQTVSLEGDDSMPTTRRPIQQVFGSNVRRLREAKTWSVRELAKRTGFDVSFVEATEAGNIDVADWQITIFATELEVDVTTLLDRRRGNT